jgi:excisionase family DNA binding protein
MEERNMECVIFSGAGRSTLKTVLREIVLEILTETEGRNKSKSDILSAGEAAVFLKIKMATLYEKTCEKKIPHFKKGNKLYFYRAELEQWLMEGKVKTVDDIRSEAISYTMNKRRRAT